MEGTGSLGIQHSFSGPVARMLLHSVSALKIVLFPTFGFPAKAMISGDLSAMGSLLFQKDMSGIFLTQSYDCLPYPVCSRVAEGAALEAGYCCPRNESHILKASAHFSLGRQLSDYGRKPRVPAGEARMYPSLCFLLVLRSNASPLTSRGIFLLFLPEDSRRTAAGAGRKAEAAKPPTYHSNLIYAEEKMRASCREGVGNLRNIR